MSNTYLRVLKNMLLVTFSRKHLEALSSGKI